LPAVDLEAPRACQFDRARIQFDPDDLPAPSPSCLEEIAARAAHVEQAPRGRHEALDFVQAPLGIAPALGLIDLVAEFGDEPAVVVGAAEAARAFFSRLRWHLGSPSCRGLHRG